MSGQLKLFTPGDFLTVKEASLWASEYLKKDVTPANISYLINYGRIQKYGDNGQTCVSKEDLIKYYASFNGKRELSWKDKLGDDLNWTLSFDNYKESETTKHVHRLHPYKGKFIPQLVEYFLDDHTDNFKKEVYFHKDDIVLDPFCGSGTTLVQANEIGINAVGIDVSFFNSFVSNTKINKYDIQLLLLEANKISLALRKYLENHQTPEFENVLLDELNKFNNKYFPSPEYKRKLATKEIEEEKYAPSKEKLFLPIYEALIKKYGITLKQNKQDKFLDKWFIKHVREEIDFVAILIDQVEDENTRNILKVILSRTIRSCRATTHSDLATLLEPITTTYYCHKHGKICKPLFSILRWWETYSQDTITRINTFASRRTDTKQICLTGDSRNINLVEELKKNDKKFVEIVKKKKINGIFSSPPYVGLIDYHEQHAYAYDLFGFPRHDESEIGPLFKGRGKIAQEDYKNSIATVLNNLKQYLVPDYNIFLVANDKHGLYQSIAELAGMKIVNQFNRPVLNRTEKDKTAYSEIIFHFKRG